MKYISANLGRQKLTFFSGISFDLFYKHCNRGRSYKKTSVYFIYLVFLGNCLWGKLSFGETVFWGNCLGETAFWENCLLENLFLQKDILFPNGSLT